MRIFITLIATLAGLTQASAAERTDKILILGNPAGTQTVQTAFSDPETAPSAEGLAELIRPDLLKSFKPTLLGRMNVVPYMPLADAVLRRIIEMQMRKIGDRLKTNHKATFTFDPKVV